MLVVSFGGGGGEGRGDEIAQVVSTHFKIVLSHVRRYGC